MDNITLDTTNFSEQLGLYDFFDVIVSGAVLVFGASAISQTIYTLLWQDITVAKGLGIVLLVYISGVVLQEIGSILDRHFFRIKHFTRSTFLFDIEDIKTKHKLRYWFWSLLEKNRLIHSKLFKKYAKVIQKKIHCHQKTENGIGCSVTKHFWTIIGILQSKFMKILSLVKSSIKKCI